MKFSHDITDIMHDRPGRCDGVLDNSTMLTTAPDSQESQTAKFVDPTGAYGENPEWERSSRIANLSYFSSGWHIHFLEN